ncbi:Isopenicillin N synthase [Aliiroseovarius halocynthiae]|uniref:2-oxoglutarate-dependent ethylene/succinate-forming enzyme n=1 Tax=Aliiroseovarius halocynthiae TaxID=985055 RepID=A0A545SSB5_9RHOB|nr:2OG-Fe(II) oxygenase family protein [Aliiroseovarius halocynthiae]TQV67835.1 isopenicillin N synthase family oxygenase [Aliiroseovarius halocynthiae]SMR72926.1 Isopenicillin N synthase [Aliiroseovarius halocynthiae]
MIPRLDAALIDARDPATMAELLRGVQDVGFLTVHNTAIAPEELGHVLDTYRRFFHQPDNVKDAVNMARTGANRGWGAAGSEQVDLNANPDFKEVFDCGFQLAADDPLRAQDLSVYGDNQWPELVGFREVIQAYYANALGVAMGVLRGIAAAIGEDETYFDAAFTRPMALLRGNYYPPRPDWAGDKDFGIAAHTDYGCVTLLASDGVAGLEVLGADKTWLPVNAPLGDFVINFGEMLEMWTGGRVKATLHRVVGSGDERISVPMFFNPNHDTNVAPKGADHVILAGDHMKKRFDETYLHLMAQRDS